MAEGGTAAGGAAEGGAAEPESFEELTRALRGSLASLRAAAETLELFPQMDAAQQRRLRGVVGGEALRLGELVDRLELLGDRERAARHAAASPARLQRRGAAEIAAAVAARAAARSGLRVDPDDPPPAEAAGEAPVELELEALLAALIGLLEALRDELAVAGFKLRWKVAERHAVFDLLWAADPASLDRLRAWQSEALERGRGGPGLRPVVRRHGGEAWFNLDRDASRAYLRLLLPLAS